MELALRLLSFKRLLGLLGRRSLKRPDETSAARGLSLPRLQRLVEVAGRYAPVEPTCLKSALVLSWFLQEQGIAAALRIGVSRRDGAFAAHAWLEQDGQVIHGLAGCDGHEPLLSARLSRSDG